mmetsp:Transcript_12923/g.21871  ORF Transcript_12923/g.21871 Transcript_12923/m.21871 type:complete len:373 (-) Transcript_12923:1496-2614(-)
MKRRGLNFITDCHETNLDPETIAEVEGEVDNVAPKVIGILPLSSHCDTKSIKQQMIDYCLECEGTLTKMTKKEAKAAQKSAKAGLDAEIKGETEEGGELDPYRAYVCPNAGSNNNLSSNRQRLIFMEIDPSNVYSVLDVGKVADIILMVMSADKVDEKQLKTDPDNCSGAIDEHGYKALALLRAQGLMSLIGVLQHLEKTSSKRQSQVKRLFLRYFESEFTSKHKFLTVNSLNLKPDINALLRQIAVTFPANITWRDDRSYMVTQQVRPDKESKELVVSGYIKNNFVNIKRLIHITGLKSQQAFRIKQVELNRDPCPVKLSQKEISKVRSTSRAQSIISSREQSRQASRRDSRAGSMDMQDEEEIKTNFKRD